MSSVSGTSSAAVNEAQIRNEFAANALRDQNQQERQVVERLEEAQESDADRRETRRIPGMGEAVDITV